MPSELTDTCLFGPITDSRGFRISFREGVAGLDGFESFSKSPMIVSMF